MKPRTKQEASAVTQVKDGSTLGPQQQRETAQQTPPSEQERFGVQAAGRSQQLPPPATLATLSARTLATRQALDFRKANLLGSAQSTLPQ